ncbi:MAG TPA: hypothetical protein VHC49_03290 [Mycobacteriales bacterium]|nr:hypothetical protein [Mycobacteriales bacterium]
MNTETELRAGLQAFDPEPYDIDLPAVRGRARRIRSRRRAAYVATVAGLVAVVVGAVTLSGGGSGDRPVSEISPPPHRITVEGFTVNAWVGAEGSASPVPNDPSIVFNPVKRRYEVLKDYIPLGVLPGGKQLLVTPRIALGRPAVMDIASQKIVRRMPGEGRLSPNGREFLSGGPKHYQVTATETGKSRPVTIPSMVDGQQVENVLWYYDDKNFTVQLKPGHGHSHRNALVNSSGDVLRIFPFSQVIDSATDWSPGGRYVIAHDRPVQHNPKGGESYVTGGPIFIVDARTGAKVARIQKDLSFDPVGVWWIDDRTFLLDRRLTQDRPVPDPVQFDLIGLDGEVQRTDTLPPVGKNNVDESYYTMLLSR